MVCKDDMTGSSSWETEPEQGEEPVQGGEVKPSQEARQSKGKKRQAQRQKVYPIGSRSNAVRACQSGCCRLPNIPTPV
jgi:hypothetical protein